MSIFILTGWACNLAVAGIVCLIANIEVLFDYLFKC